METIHRGLVSSSAWTVIPQVWTTLKDWLIDTINGVFRQMHCIKFHWRPLKFWAPLTASLSLSLSFSFFDLKINSEREREREMSSPFLDLINLTKWPVLQTIFFLGNEMSFFTWWLRLTDWLIDCMFYWIILRNTQLFDTELTNYVVLFMKIFQGLESWFWIEY